MSRFVSLCLVVLSQVLAVGLSHVALCSVEFSRVSLDFGSRVKLWRVESRPVVVCLVLAVWLGFGKFRHVESGFGSRVMLWHVMVG